MDLLETWNWIHATRRYHIRYRQFSVATHKRIRKRACKFSAVVSIIFEHFWVRLCVDVQETSISLTSETDAPVTLWRRAKSACPASPIIRNKAVQQNSSCQQGGPTTFQRHAFFPVLFCFWLCDELLCLLPLSLLCGIISTAYWSSF